MSHLRHDKNCLNCGFRVEERYCSRCGQENAEPKESVGHLVGHFFADVTHFDSKLFVTLKDLIIRPGFLTREYVAGRRVTYLNPIRMYIFISAVFFLVLFAGGEEGGQHDGNDPRVAKVDSASGAGKSDTGKSGAVKAPSESLSLNYGSGGRVLIDIVENKYKTLTEYDSVQRTLPDSSRDTGVMAWILRNNVRQKEKHEGRTRMHLEVNVQHDIPKLMFVLLPLFALYVGWFYSRRKYYYVNHAIFSVHFHSFVFLFFLFLMLLSAVVPGDWSGPLLIAILTKGWVGVLLALLFPMPVFIYLVAALRGAYGQSVGMAFVKALAISLLYFVTLTAASVALMVIALMRA